MTKFTVEIHVKSSVLQDSIEQWVKSGREDNRSQGSFIFENCDSVDTEDGILTIKVNNDYYAYNMSDLYRVKTTVSNQNKEE